MKQQPRYTDKFQSKSFSGCLNNKSEILQGKLCGCYNCCEVSNVQDIVEWITEPNGGEDSAACPNCTFDSVLSDKFPIQEPDFLLAMRKFHFGS